MIAESVLDLVRLRMSAQVLHAASRDQVAAISRVAGSHAGEFLVFLTDERLQLVDVFRVERSEPGLQGFPLSQMLTLASRSKAAGMIVVQQRDDLVPRRPDLELTQLVRRALRETGTELLDHLLVSGDQVRSAGGLHVRSSGACP